MHRIPPVVSGKPGAASVREEAGAIADAAAAPMVGDTGMPLENLCMVSRGKQISA